MDEQLTKEQIDSPIENPAIQPGIESFGEEDIQRRRESLQASLEQARGQSQKETEVNLAQIDESISELGSAEPEEIAAAKSSVTQIGDQINMVADAAKKKIMEEKLQKGITEKSGNETGKTSARNQPKFREFSKRESPKAEERSQLAQEIRERRKKYFSEKNNIKSKEQEKNEIIKKVKALRDQVESYNNATFLAKIRDFFAIKKIKAELHSQLGKQSLIEGELSKSISGRQDLEKTRKMIADFYTKEKKEWAEMPYSKEDIARYFTEDNLASLSTEDYATLLQRFPGEMLTHVTRHGIRDHADLGNHQAGLGEYHDTLYSVLKNKALKSALGIKLQEYSKEDAVAKFLELEDCSSRNEALGRIQGIFVSGATGDPNRFADLSAVHLAVENVADSYYGSERNNEVFFVFPSALIAAQYEFSGNLSAVDHNLYTDSYDNDQFVWPDIERGLLLDAGIAFFPEDAKVDSKNGSRYELNQDNMPIPTEGIQEILKARFDQSGFVQVFIQKRYEIDRLPEDEKQAALEKRFESFGIKDAVAKKMLSDENLLKQLAEIWGTKNEKNEYEKILMEYFQKNGSPYKLANDPVSSRGYWENYFRQHPESKPRHLVYYSGGDPAKSLDKWRQNNGIIKKDGSSDMGFPENKASRDAKNEDETQQRFVSIARSVVDKFFPKNSEKQSKIIKLDNGVEILNPNYVEEESLADSSVPIPSQRNVPPPIPRI